MKLYRSAAKLFLAIGFAILIVLFSGRGQAAEPQPGQPALSQAAEEAVTEKKLPEKPPEVLPQYVPGAIPSAAIQPYSLTFGPGPITGSLAPYGNSLAEDTLLRGWQSHYLGAARVTPYLGYGALYRTNVFQTYSNKQSDFCNMINPGIQFELPVAGTHKFSLGYLANGFLYNRFSGNDHYDQNVNADLVFNFSKLSVNVGNTYRNAAQEASLVQNGPLISTVAKRPYNQEIPYFNAACKLADLWRIETNYQLSYLAYSKTKDQYNSSMNNYVGETIFYKFWPKTSALIQYLANITTFPNNNLSNYVIHTPMAGIQWDPTAKLSGSIKVGYSISDYYNRNVGLGNINANGGMAFSVQTLYRLSNYTQISLVAQRCLVTDPNYGNNTYFNQGLMLTVSHLWHYFDVTSYGSFSYYNNPYVFSTIDSGTNQIKTRNDNIIYANLGLSRPITAWLQLRLDYFYYNRGSNFTYYAANESKVMLGLQTSY